MLEKIPVVLIDDQQLIREAWKLMLNTDPRFHVTAQYTRPQDAQLASSVVTLFNINKPAIEGQWAAINLVKNFPGIRLMVISEHNEARYVRQLLHAGVAAFVTKTSSFDELMNGIVQVSEGISFVSEDVRASIEIDLY